MNAIQRFVKSIGSYAFICRTVWRKNSSSYAWIITNKKDFYNEDTLKTENYIVQPKTPDSCTIIRTISGKHIQDTVPYIENIVRFLKTHLFIEFKEFIVDFIKDEGGIWWAINIKGFILEQEDPMIN